MPFQDDITNGSPFTESSDGYLMALDLFDAYRSENLSDQILNINKIKQRHEQFEYCYRLEITTSSDLLLQKIEEKRFRNKIDLSNPKVSDAQRLFQYKLLAENKKSRARNFYRNRVNKTRLSTKLNQVITKEELEKSANIPESPFAEHNYLLKS